MHLADIDIYPSFKQLGLLKNKMENLRVWHNYSFPKHMWQDIVHSVASAKLGLLYSFVKTYMY